MQKSGSELCKISYWSKPYGASAMIKPQILMYQSPAQWFFLETGKLYEFQYLPRVDHVPPRTPEST